jgi:hypothetical protein
VRRSELVCDQVGIDQGRAEIHEALGHGGLAAPDTPCKTHHQWCPGCMGLQVGFGWSSVRHNGRSAK